MQIRPKMLAYAHDLSQYTSVFLPHYNNNAATPRGFWEEGSKQYGRPGDWRRYLPDLYAAFQISSSVNKQKSRFYTSSLKANRRLKQDGGCSIIRHNPLAPISITFTANVVGMEELSDYYRHCNRHSATTFSKEIVLESQ